MMTQKNVLHVLVGENRAAIADSTTIDAVGDLLAGQMAILDVNNTKIAAATDLDTVNTFRFVANQDGRLVYTPFIERSKIKSVKAKAYVAPVQQVSYFGYNGTSGSLDVINSNEYFVKILLNDIMRKMTQRARYFYGDYKSTSTATQSAIAFGLADTLTVNSKNEYEQIVKVERINSGAQLNAMASATAAVINGSTLVTLSEDESLTCPAGSIIRLGGTGAGTTPCYIVSAISANGLTVTLDIPYQGITETIAHGNVETVTEGNWGLKFTGVARSVFQAGVYQYDVPSFEIFTTGFTTSSATYTTAAVRGAGTYQQAQEAEWFVKGNRGSELRTAGFPLPQENYNLVAASGSTYETITIEFEEQSGTGVITEPHTNTIQLVMFFVVGSGQGDEFITQLNTMSSPLAPGMTAGFE